MSSLVHLFEADSYVLEYAIFRVRMFGIVAVLYMDVPEMLPHYTSLYDKERGIKQAVPTEESSFHSCLYRDDAMELSTILFVQSCFTTSRHSFRPVP